MPADDFDIVQSSVDDPSPFDRPTIPQNSSLSLTRRTLLRLLSGSALALASGAVLAGCGGGGGGGGGSNNGGGGGGSTTPGTVAGTLNSSQIGGSNLLVQSVYQTDTPMTNNKFTVKVSPQGAQLLLVSDGIGQVYALAVSVPGVSALTVDATSTALALVFMTPGILATDPKVATTRLSQIAALSSFAPVVSFLESHLPTSPLSVLIAAGTLSGLVYTCVTDWFKVQTGSVKKPNVSSGFSVALGSLANPSAVPVTLANSGLRWINIVRRYVDANGNLVGTPQLLFDSLGGAQNLSLTTLLTAGNPTTAGDTVNTLTPSVAAIQYWVRGPGGNTTSLFLPGDISSSETSAWVISVILYLLVPLLQSALGLSGTYVSKQAFQDIAAVWTQNSTSINISQIITDVGNQNFQSSGSDLIKTILLPLISNSAFMQALIQVLARDVTGASTLTLTLAPILDVVTLFSTLFEYPLCTGALTEWFALPHLINATFYLSNGGITVS